MRAEVRRFLIIAALGLTGCEEFSEGPEAWWLGDFVLEFPAPGDSVVFTMPMLFTDPDGDVTGARISVEDPDGGSTVYDDCRIPASDEQLPCPLRLNTDFEARDLDGVTTGTIHASVLRDSMLGDYSFEASVLDSEGFESNRLLATITLVEGEPGE